MAIQMKGKKAFHVFIFILLGIFLFILFLFIGLPYESFKRRIIGELEAKTPFHYEIEAVRPYPLWGLTFKNVVIYASIDSKKIKVLGVERMRITVSLLPLLWRRVSLRLRGKILDGTLEGRFTKRRERGELTLLGRDVNLQRIHILRDAVGVEMAGILEGKTMLTLGGGGISKQSGSADFVISEAILGKFPLPGIAPLRIGHIQCSIELKHGNVMIKRLAFTGEDLKGKVLGNIILNSHFSRSRLNLRITIEPSGTFDPRHRVLLSLLGREGQAEGSFAFSLRGTVGRPRFVTK